ncbi:MAG TPA: hypothetical protein IAC73_04855 [Candidatus Limadaptatus stercoripullorum]|uniref:Uncharacterized protein n=1 Tax=Candidatus Limadaptatus stercoripullorum TaxID=2840846 RepID=A0A9D1NAK1_9FIRM|nr:hypothetical protein [Candidatus Limadaptatus stercoripullorum]
MEEKAGQLGEPAVEELGAESGAVFGVAFSMIFYHERLTLQVGMGFAVIFVALLLNEVLPKLIASRRDAAFPSVRPRTRAEVYKREPCA